MTHVSRHIVVAPILSAPLLTDTRRSTVGPGTREDLACVVGGVRRTSALRNIGNMFLLYSGMKKVPFVVSICATAPFVRCDTGAHAGDAVAVHHVALCR